MRFVLVNWAFETHGSAQDIHNYAHVAQTLGHEVVLYGPAEAASAFDCSREVSSADAVLFVFEYTTYLERLDFVRLMGKVPRERRAVVDCDGNYNDMISVEGDFNHSDHASSRRWMDVCDSLSDKIYQPTLHPLRPNVRTFFFHAYNPDWEVELDFSSKEYGLCYVGNNWFRWAPMYRILQALEPVRQQIGELALIGHGWNSPAPWGDPAFSGDAYFMDRAYLDKLSVKILPPVRFDRVIPSMGLGVLTPVIYRPLFDHLRFVTCRTFETLAANTIPVFAQDAEYVREIYGECAMELLLPTEDPQEKILDIIRRPDSYVDVVEGIRRHLAEHHSYAARIRQLAEIVQS